MRGLLRTSPLPELSGVLHERAQPPTARAHLALSRVHLENFDSLKCVRSSFLCSTCGGKLSPVRTEENPTGMFSHLVSRIPSRVPPSPASWPDLKTLTARLAASTLVCI